MSKIFTNPNQLEEWVEAALGIHDRFSIEKALGYLIGGKFYRVVFMLHSSRELISSIDEERKKPAYIPICETIYENRKIVTNLDEIYEKNIVIIADNEEALARFATLIKETFEPYEIQEYFESNPRLGIHGHISTDEDYDFLVSKGAVEQSVYTEVRDALILWDMMKYFGVSLNNLWHNLPFSLHTSLIRCACLLLE
jgi:hypothetical protein